MKRILLIFIITFFSIPLLTANTFRLVQGTTVYYLLPEKDSVVSVFPSANTILDGSLYVWSDGTFKVMDTVTKKRYICNPGKNRPGQRLINCIQKVTENGNAEITPTYTVSRKGIDDSQPRFHYIYILVNQFDSYDFDTLAHNAIGLDSFELAMNKALNSTCIRQQEYNGKHYRLISSTTTKQSIIDHLDTLKANTHEGDLVWIYISTHGVKDVDNNFYLLAKDAYKDSSTGAFKNAISGSEINAYVNELTSKNARVMLFVDACHSGALLEDDSIDGEAVYYVSSSGKDNSLQYPERHIWSPFADAILATLTGSIGSTHNECLDKNAFNHFQDGKVYADSLGKYLEESVSCQWRQIPEYQRNNFSPYYILWDFPVRSNSINIDELIKGANAGDAKYMIELGDIYYQGIYGTTIDYYQAKAWYDKASNSKDKTLKAEAYLKLSDFYAIGNPSPNATLAFDNALIAAKLGNVNAMYNVGNFYEDGYGHPKDEKEGLKWINKAAHKGHEKAKKRVKTISFERGEIVDFYSEKGFLLTEININKKKVDPIYQFMMGEYYFFGYHHIEKNQKKAIEWYEKAAKQNYPQALNALGVHYHNGVPDVLTMNRKKAFELFMQAALQGYSHAMNNVGNCYFTGDGLWEAIPDSAVYWYRKAADKGLAEAQYNLGICYLNGIGVGVPDIDTAMKWLKQAAEQGYSIAQQKLGECYEKKGNHHEATKWYKEAVNRKK